jgi:tetratricopeptide (TPR) repeat protein
MSFRSLCGQPERAAELARHALDMTLAPSRTHWVYQLDIQYLNGDYEAAIAAADHAQDVIWAVPAWRAAALAQLGRFEEAAVAVAETTAKIRANWFGDSSPTDEEIMKWMLHVFSFRRREDWEHLRDGWARASFPVGSIEYNELW